MSQVIVCGQSYLDIELGQKSVMGMNGVNEFSVVDINGESFP